MLGLAAAGPDLRSAAGGYRRVDHRGREVLAQVLRHLVRSRPSRTRGARLGTNRAAHDCFDDETNRRLRAALAVVDPVPAVDTAVAGTRFAARVANTLDQLAGDVDAVDADGG